VDTERIAATFVSLADSLVKHFDVYEVLQTLTGRCVDVLGLSAAGLMLADEQGRLQVMASSSESARMLELLQLQNDAGPCLECYRGGEPVAVEDLEGEQERWPGFGAEALAEGFRGVHALPMRVRGQVIGALNLFSTAETSPVDEQVLAVAQGFADVASITILQDRLARSRVVLNEQLQTALDSRVAIEQAKGILAARLDVGMGEAFELLRGRARSSRRRLVDVATEVVTAGIDSDWVGDFQRRPGSRRR
jgi:GAF domain-containing protein